MADQLTRPLLLYAEDEPIIQLMTRATLEDAGFELIVAGSGDEAVHLLETERDRIAGLVTDVDLGQGPTGWTVARCARMLIARIPVLYASSASELEWMANGVPLSRLLAKPWGPASIVQTIRALLLPGTDDGIPCGRAGGEPGDIRTALLARRAAIARVGQSPAARRATTPSWA